MLISPQPKPIYEFLLWENCNNRCAFCFQKAKRQLKVAERENALEAALRFLNSDRYQKGSHVLAVGGELFYSPNLFGALFRFYVRIFEKMRSGEIDMLYINTNLLYRDTDTLMAVLREGCGRGLARRIRFTTSFDLAGRFATADACARMEANLDRVRESFPDLPVVTNIMLTGQTCRAIMTEQFSVASFAACHACEVNLIPYIVKREEYRPEKREVLAALLKTEAQMPGYLDRWLANWELKQEKRLFQYDKTADDFCFVSSSVAACGHSENFRRCFDDGTCFICFVRDMLNG